MTTSPDASSAAHGAPNGSIPPPPAPGAVPASQQANAASVTPHAPAAAPQHGAPPQSGAGPTPTYQAPHPGQVPTHAQQHAGPAITHGDAKGRQGAHVILSKRIVGLPPLLFVAICLLTVVALVTIVLIFAADVEDKGARVFMTVASFAVFTGLLLLDMTLAKTSIRPLLIGAIANLYILAIVLTGTWVSSDESGVLGLVLFGALLFVVFVVRALGALAWWLLSMGDRGDNGFLRTVAIIGAVTLALVAVGLTLPWLLSTMHLDVPSIYWQIVVSLVVVAALAVTITVIVYWNITAERRRAREAAEPSQVLPPAAPQHRVQPPVAVAQLPPPTAYYPTQQYPAQQPTGQSYPGPQPTAQPYPAQPYPGQPYPGQQYPGQH